MIEQKAQPEPTTNDLPLPRLLPPCTLDPLPTLDQHYPRRFHPSYRSVQRVEVRPQFQSEWLNTTTKRRDDNRVSFR